jgi:hypothetical protein
MDRAPVFGTGCWGFESLLGHHLLPATVQKLMHSVAEMSALGHSKNSALHEQSAVEGFLLRSARFIVRRYIQINYFGIAA